MFDVGATMSDERSQIEVAIAALEAQRDLLGDAVVDTAIAPLKAKLISPDNEPRVRRRQVTIMFADLSGYTTLSEELDPEALAAMLTNFWTAVDGIITDHRGNVLQHMGDGVLAVWGDTQSFEDDAQQAVRAALAIVEAIDREGITISGRRIDATVSIGVNTGPVHLRSLDQAGYTTLGDTTNVAARLEGAAGIGETLISRATYHQIRGVFSVEDAGPLQLKGRKEPVHAYRVLRELPSADQSHRHGFEGRESRLIGRDDESRLIQSRLRATLDDGTPSIITLIGDAGIGKSRLVDASRGWATDGSQSVEVIEGRSLPDTSHTPFALLKSMLTNHFTINDTEDRDAVLAKLDAGFRDVLGDDGPGAARSIGWLVGLLPGESGVGRDDAQFRRNNAIADLSDFLNQLASADHPTMLVLEDLHWADDDSLDVIADAAADLPNGLLVLATARPELLVGRTDWGASAGLGPSHHSLRIRPLGTDHCVALLEDVLAPLGAIPTELQTRVIEQCDGNPFHVEELVKMLIEDRVIDTTDTPWRFDAERLSQAKVPTTLTGVLQARLDHVTSDAFSVLQAGSVFGRFFWDTAAERLLGSGVSATSALDELAASELTLRREFSRFAHTMEAVFKHDFTRVVTYDTIDLQDRPAMHGQAAEWLTEAAGARSDEFAASIARHHALAENTTSAAEWYTRAARQAQGQSAYEEAARLFALAGEHADSDSSEQLQLIIDQSYALVVAGLFDQARDLLTSLLQTAEESGRTRHWMLACTELSRIALFLDGDFDHARELLEGGLERGLDEGLEEETLLVRHQLGNVAIVSGDWPEAIRLHTDNVERAGADGEMYRRGWGLNSLAHAHAHQGNYELALLLAEETRVSAEKLSDPRLAMAAHAQKGLVEMHRGNWAAATDFFGEAQVLNRRNGDPEKLATVANYLGECALGAQDDDAAFSHFDEAREVSTRSGVKTELVRATVGLSELAARRGHDEMAAHALAVASASPSAASEARRMITAACARTDLDLPILQDPPSVVDTATALSLRLRPAPFSEE